MAVISKITIDGEKYDIADKNAATKQDLIDVIESVEVDEETGDIILFYDDGKDNE